MLSVYYYKDLSFFREDDLLTCKKSTKNKTKQQHKSTWQKIDNISLALMKQFNLFPVARGMLTITHDRNIISCVIVKRSEEYITVKSYQGVTDLTVHHALTECILYK